VRIRVVGGRREPESFYPALTGTLCQMTQAVNIMFTAGAKSGREGRSGRLRKAGRGGANLSHFAQPWREPCVK
jgi:hypothetical protein